LAASSIVGAKGFGFWLAAKDTALEGGMSQRREAIYFCPYNRQTG
jgi:hypothetical protein